VVIDEAHNIAPEQPANDKSAGVVEILTRIAMEGRKYGLFLILVTQRPSRVSSNLLSQCDNLCLMKMSNPADVNLVKERFGIIPPELADKALEFKKGQVVLCGQFVERPVVAQVSPRRTVEGGRSLRDDFWLADPCPRQDE
jgi:DNA helicase HerA-like ATPase